MDVRSPEAAPRAGPSTTAIIVVLALCGTLSSLQQTVVLPLLPDFPGILSTTTDNATWLVTATLLTAAVGMPIVSRLADMFGKRRMLLLCMWSVIVGSAISALSADLRLVILGRSIAGFGSCLVPVGISLMRDHLPLDRVGSGVALMSATLGIGSAVGLPLAGVVYEFFNWHAIFGISAGFAAIMLVAAHRVVPESTVKSLGRFDYLGALLLSVALACFLLAVSKSGTWGWGAPLTLTLFAGAALMFALWVPWELRVGQPLVDIRTSTRRTVLLTNTASLLIGLGMFTNFLTSAQQVQMPVETGYGFGLSVTATGLVMLPGGLLMVLMAPVSAKLIARFGPRHILIVGSLIIAFALIFRSLFYGSVLQVAMGATIASAGISLSFASMPTLIMSSVPITETASANGLNTLLRAIGTSTASALVATLFTVLVMQTDDGQWVPSTAAYQVMFWIGTVAALCAALCAAFTRRPEQLADDASETNDADTMGEGPAGGATKSAELLVTGRVVTESGVPLKQAVATVLRPDGRHVDWSRIDNSGRYALAIPEPGEYLVIVSAEGWAPQSALHHLDDGEVGTITVRGRLLLSGHVTDRGAPLSDVVVSLISHAGDYVATTTADGAGVYEIGLPPAGRYVLTVVDHQSGRARSRSLTVLSTTMTTLDIDIDTGVPAPRPAEHRTS